MNVKGFRDKTVVGRPKGKHSHIHGLATKNRTKYVDYNVTALVAKDALLLQDRSHDRASFQGRFRKTAFGDFKGRPGRATEHIDGLMEDHEFEDKKAEAARAAAAVTEAAAADGVIVEEPNA